MKFEVIEKPNDWTKEIKRQTSSSPTLQAGYDYWVAFNEYAFNNTAFAKVFSRRKASTDHWMSLSVGSSACHMDLSQVRKDNNITVEWYITDDKELYQKFYFHNFPIHNLPMDSLEQNNKHCLCHDTRRNSKHCLRIYVRQNSKHCPW